MATVTNSDDWIEHTGQGLPVALNANVQVQFRFDRDRRTAGRSNTLYGVPAHGLLDCWTHQDAQSDIVAYRVVA